MNAANRNARAALWDKATTLPDARDEDFFGSNRRPAGVDPEQLKIITDTSLRSRLIEARIAMGLQSPKGPQKIASIIRLYPNFDAPEKDAPTRSARAADSARVAYGLPSVEDLEALIARIREIEREVRAELQAQVDADIGRLKREIGELEGAEFEAAYQALGRALGARKRISAQVRHEAFKRVDAETDFAPRTFLRLLAREPKE